MPQDKNSKEKMSTRIRRMYDCKGVDVYSYNMHALSHLTCSYMSTTCPVAVSKEAHHGHWILETLEQVPQHSAIADVSHEPPGHAAADDAPCENPGPTDHAARHKQGIPSSMLFC